jgi:hypothetical protein
MDFLYPFRIEKKGCVVTETPRPKNLTQLFPLDNEKAKIGNRKIRNETAK